MANRLSRIGTRTGDDGTTGLGDGTRVAKDDPRVAAIGDVDELNSVLGLLSCEALPDDVRAALLAIQHDLFDLGGELSIPGLSMIGEAQVARLDEQLASYNTELPPLAEFVLPGGSRAASLAHVARTVCRRAERAMVALNRAEQRNGTDDLPEGAIEPRANTAALQYVNRLSDLLFVVSRVLNRHAGVGEVLWDRARASGDGEDT